MIQELVKNSRIATEQRDEARRQRDTAMHQYNQLSSLIKEKNARITNLNAELKRAIQERNDAVYLKHGVEQRFSQTLIDFEWVMRERRKAINDKNELLEALSTLHHERNAAWDTVARLNDELNESNQQKEILMAGRTGLNEPAVPDASVSEPIVAQRKAARLVDERNHSLKKQKLI